MKISCTTNKQFPSKARPEVTSVPLVISIASHHYVVLIFDGYSGSKSFIVTSLVLQIKLHATTVEDKRTRGHFLNRKIRSLCKGEVSLIIKNEFTLTLYVESERFGERI